MTLFVIVAGLLVAVALAFLVLPLLRSRSGPTAASRATANALIYREQLEELRAELERGAITREEFERAGREIERRIVAELGAGGAPAPAASRPLVAAAIAIGLLLPLAAGLGYWQLGNPAALEEGATQPLSREQVEALVARLWLRMQQTPEDAEGWVLLARAFTVLGDHRRSVQAYERAVKLLPNDAGLEAEYANARERVSSATALSGVVSLDPALAGKVSPGDTVFVIARPVSGPRMPLAVARTTVAELPYRFTLDDSMAMAPEAKLSGHAQVVVAARVSKSGKAAPQKGDIEGASAPVAPGESNIQVVVSRVVQ